ncbi:MAG: biotin--[acetyl-CoA-carboxylase] ligase [Flavobacteriales bacterium CG_4_9_14_0_2_um_filter_32_27]|nr:MAG: biotin--[acetyl-CoA-carboxylase] ligase [Flavobacteriales bacterium CG_4_9_14_0_2_um_filter_32_27]
MMLNTLFHDKKLIHLQEIDSTNEYAKSLIKVLTYVSEGTTIVAKNQLHGRGQMGSSWESNPCQNLTFSVIISPKILVVEQFQISKIVALALISFLNQLGIKNTSIKWPNDIYIKEKKIAGILIENILKNNKIEHTIIGIGLNVNQVDFTTKNATSLQLITSQAYDLNILLANFIEILERNYFLLKSNQHAVINEAYLKNLLGFQKERKFSTSTEQFKAIIIGVSSMGKLQLQKDEQLMEMDIKEITFL